MNARQRQFTRRIGATPVTAEALEDLAAPAEALLDIFENYADELRDGFSVQAGWAPFLLAASGSGELRVLAPGFTAKTSDQVGWAADLALALWVLKGQLASVRALNGPEPQPLHFTDTVLCYRGITTADRILMSRTTRKDKADDSGWYLDVRPQPRQPRQPPDFVRWPAYQLLGINKHLARALLLPAGYGAVVSGQRIDAIINLTTMRVAAPSSG